MKDMGMAMKATETQPVQDPLRKRLEDLSGMVADCCAGLNSIIGPEIKDECKEAAKPLSGDLGIAHGLMDLIFERVNEVQRQIQRINERL